jgi:hypothetical protein
LAFQGGRNAYRLVGFNARTTEKRAVSPVHSWSPNRFDFRPGFKRWGARMAAASHLLQVTEAQRQSFLSEEKACRAKETAPAPMLRRGTGAPGERGNALS